MVLCDQSRATYDADIKKLNQHQCEDVDPCEYAKIVGCDHLKSKRARKFRCRSKRVRQLAKPKNVTQKNCGEETKFGERDVEIIRTFEEQTPVRIKWLAYPNVRKLMSSCEAYKEIVSKNRHGRLEDLIRQSMLTLYSRLANVQPPNKICQRKWTRAERKRHSEWLKSRAVPKRVFKQPTPKRKKVPLETLVTSMYLLSRPRYPQAKYHPQKGYRSAVKENAMTYEPSERILKLAAPKRLVDENEEGEEKDPFQVNPKALKFEPSERLKKLAISKPRPQSFDYSQLTESGVVKRALKAKINERTVELAKPKEKDDEEEEKPLVNPKALKAKPTPRILELAKPRVIPA